MGLTNPPRKLTYNSWDVIATARGHKFLVQTLKDQGQYDYYQRQVWPAVDACLAMQRRGLLTDVPWRTQYRRTLRKELRETDDVVRTQFNATHDIGPALGLCLYQLWRWSFPVEAKMRRRKAPFTKGEWPKVAKHFAIDPKLWDSVSALWATKWESDKPGFFNVNSPDHVRDWLFKEAGLKWLIKAEKSSKPSVKQEALLWSLRHLLKRDEPYRETLLSLLHRSRLSTIDKRYLSFTVDKEGFCHPTIKVHGAETGRLAYANPPLHQWPKEIRRMFIARPGHVFVGADYHQLEARVHAAISGDPQLQSIFAQGINLHTHNTKLMFDDWEDLNEKQFALARDATKVRYFGIVLYGGAAETYKAKEYCPCPKCERDVPINVPRAKENLFVQRWNARHPVAVGWRRDLVDSVLGWGSSRWYTNPFGRTRRFDGPRRDCEREVMNYPIQSTADDIKRRALIALHHEHKAPLVLDHHDFLMLEVPRADAPHWMETLVTEMERPVPELDNTVFPVDPVWGENWGEMEAWT